MTTATTRRSFLRTGAAAALGVSMAGKGARAGAGRGPRVGIVGGGLAGVSCAWLLDGVAEAVLFESRPELGGYAQTIRVAVGDEEIPVDVGAQFFARGPHPTYTRLLEVVGLLNPAFPDDDATVEADMTITVTEAGEERPRFLSVSKARAWPILAPWNRPALWAFLVFALAAKRFCRDGDWRLPLGVWLQRLPVPAQERENLLLPLLGAMVGCSLEQARGLSARSALVFVGQALPENLLDPVRYSNSLLGLGGNVDHLAQRSHNLTVHLGSPVTSVRGLGEGGYRIRNAAGIREDVDVVVFATPPHVTRPLLSEIPELGEAASVLERFEYFTAEISIHRDPVYMPRRPRFWSAYNADVDDGRCEASIWYGALRPVPEGQAPLPLFKSWATARREPPREEVFRRVFRHPLITPDFIESQRDLAAHQGRANVWFAGSYTQEVDSQETALTSAMRVVEDLDPEAPNLLALR